MCCAVAIPLNNLAADSALLVDGCTVVIIVIAKDVFLGSHLLLAFVERIFRYIRRRLPFYLLIFFLHLVV